MRALLWWLPAGWGHYTTVCRHGAIDETRGPASRCAAHLRAESTIACTAMSQPGEFTADDAASTEDSRSAVAEQGSVGNGPVTVVTGGNRGIGLAIARRLVAQGHRVAATSRSGQDAPVGAMPVRLDVTDMASVTDAFATVQSELGPVQVLVANAGITNDGLLMRMSEHDFASVVDTNLLGAFRCVKAATKPMMRARSGRIILISSVVALHGSPGQVNYAASKAGLVGMARALTRELGGRGITTNVVAPGFVNTEMTAQLPEATQETYRAAIPVGRFADPDEVAGVVAFLAGPLASYISGAMIPVDGGLGMGH